MDNTDAALILRCQRSDRRAQEAIYIRYADKLLPVCLRYMRHLPTAEDALVQGFTKFFNRIDRFEYRGPASVGAYLKQAVINECLMMLRKTVIVHAMEDLTAYEERPAGDDVLSGLGAKEILARIAALPDGYRTVFNLHAVEGYGHAEISAMLGISEGTSKSQLSKAKAALRHSITQTESYHAARR